MNRITLMLLGCAVIVPSVVSAQSNAEAIERSLLPLSSRTAQGASVVKLERRSDLGDDQGGDEHLGLLRPFRRAE